MNTFFDDEFINKRLFSKLVKEVKQEQLDKTIQEIDYLNEMQTHLLSTRKFDNKEDIRLDFIKKLNNAKRRNLQA